LNDNINLLIVDNYIDQELIDQLLSEPVPNRSPGRHDWPIHNSLLDKVIWRASDDLKAFYGIEEPLYADYIALTASSVGMFHILHADAETLEGSPNHTAWRWVTAMIYLNTQGEDFEGGSIVFPRIDKEISPKAGQIVGFRCDGIHAHEVTPITSGVRRAIAVWFTPNERYHSRFAPKT
jgi:predicted 2-oxoglutarate/Fe(II)-dependent dioxygenase YbiX